ncbi:MAG: phosphoenolpyruvate mutase [Candidatus Binatia bacterium]
MLRSSELEFLMEAHDGLSAKIAEEAGFRGLWASGLAMSAALGVRDSNEASWTQILEVLEFMSDATRVPILLDGDTGYGNFNNARRLVRKLHQRGIAGVCIEDKLFPKSNSFLDEAKQPLADIDEFCGKIKAMQDSKHDTAFVVLARVEAFIAGWGLAEALRRAEAYRVAGADAVLIHSKKSTSLEIDAFMQEWAGRLPVVIVPTKYYSTPTDKFRDLGVSMVIWANHAIRASIAAMQSTTRRIFLDQSLANVESQIATIAEVFRLQGDDELQAAEKRYLPAAELRVNAIILAAAQGVRFGELTEAQPKALLKVNGKSILQTQVDHFRGIGVKDITVVRGFRKDLIEGDAFTTIDNDAFAETTELYSLHRALDAVRGTTLISYGDLVFKPYILNELLHDPNSVTIIADADFAGADSAADGAYHEWVVTDQPYSRRASYGFVQLRAVEERIREGCSGEFIGLLKVNEVGAGIVKQHLEALVLEPDFATMRMRHLLARILTTDTVAVKFIRGSWMDINSIVDLQRAEGF